MIGHVSPVKKSGTTTWQFRQAGLATVEMAILSGVFLTIVLGSIEVSRLLFTWNTLNAATQRGARVATVCPPNHPMIKDVAMFGEPGSGASDSLLPGFGENNIAIRYLDSDGIDTGGAFPIEYVEVSVVNYDLSLAIPFVPSVSSITAPSFITTLSAESLGFVPDTGNRTCFGA